MRLIGMTLVSLLAVCAPVAAQSIGGTYRIDGTNFDGSRYGGTARHYCVVCATIRITQCVGLMTGHDPDHADGPNAVLRCYPFPT